ncbi:hypothetical protein BU202_08360 [Streptococcus cuniculi]|uniref:Uncharacterized protein n=1 Tax=Streptococcus cuniculi TaxID=1432788 RepID=A0A1Q8E6E0_9STRE|nr:hypothetical protein BU202_08360 [Streptococcus cuniculi]
MNHYHFRGYIIHVHPALTVFIGNNETEFIIYNDKEDYAVVAILRWIPEHQTLRVINRWRLSFEHDSQQNVFIHYDPDYRY